MYYTPDRMPILVRSRHIYPGRYLWFFALLLTLLLFSQTPVLAQFASGSISATLTDVSGAVVPNAHVVLKNEDSNAVRDTVSHSSGFSHFPSVAPSASTVTVSAPVLRNVEQY